MDDLVQFKTAVEEAGFSDDALNQMLPIIQAAIDEGRPLTSDEGEKLEKVIDTESKLAGEMVDAHEDAAKQLGTFLDELSEASGDVANVTAEVDQMLDDVPAV